MPTHIRRFLKRFAITAVIETVLVLCLISGLRLWVVRQAATHAAKYAEAGAHGQVLRALRLAYRWAPAYPAFSETVASLHAQALQQTGTGEPPPVLEPRSFTAAIPLPEKMLIPADMLMNLLYRQYSKRQEEASATTDASATEFRPGAAESAARPGIALHTPPQIGTSDRAPAPNGTPLPGTPASPATAERPAYNPDVMWGTVSAADAPLFDKNGRKMREIPAGSLVDVQETRRTASGEVVIGSVRSRQGNFNDVILRRDDVELYVGYPISTASREQLQLVSKRGELLGAIKSRQAALEAAASNRNPHQAEYRQILRQYQAINDESKQLKEQYDKATGSKRMELANRLRTLKNDQFVLMPKYQEIKSKKAEWDRGNQTSTQDTANDPQMQQLKQQLEQIDRQLETV